MEMRDLSTTLNNLKFMQSPSAVKKEEEVVPVSIIPAVKRCVVIVEGDPQPAGANRGRMSFQGFNPYIEKLNEVASESAATSSGRINESCTSSNDSNGNGKRKQREVGTKPEHTNNSRKSNRDNQDPNTGRRRGSQKLNTKSQSKKM